MVFLSLKNALLYYYQALIALPSMLDKKDRGA